MELHPGVSGGSSEEESRMSDLEQHHEEPFWRKYIFSQDHKVIGLQYGFTALLFLLFGFSLMLIMRWQLAFPGQPVPVIGALFGQDNAPVGSCCPSSTTSSEPCTARSWSFWRWCRCWWAPLATMSCRSSSGHPTWPSPSSTWRATGSTFWAASPCSPVSSSPAAPPTRAGPPIHRSPTSPPPVRPGGSSAWSSSSPRRCWARSTSSPPSFSCDPRG